MNLVSTLRQFRSQAAKAALISFVAVWLSMVLQPCLMTVADMSDQDCPHCPSVSMEMPCDATIDNCNYIDSYDYDGRATAIDIDDLLDHAPAQVVGVLESVDYLHYDTLRRASFRVRSDVNDPPLHILHCQYLI